MKTMETTPIITILLKAFTKMVNYSDAFATPERQPLLPRPLGGPRNAKRSLLMGKLTRGGLGQPLGRGEGVGRVNTNGIVMIRGNHGRGVFPLWDFIFLGTFSRLDHLTWTDRVSLYDNRTK